jgi:putative FmdB family regulatory protein
MPTYEYLCKSCGHRFDVWQSFSDDPLTECPNCGAHIQRVLFPAGIVFKGSGFYKNDSRGSATTATVASESGEGSGTKSETASETSPAAKASASKPAAATSGDSASTKTAS